MNQRKVSELIRLCKRDDGGFGTKCQYSWCYVGHLTAWCMHEDLYVAHRRTLDVVIANAGRQWVERNDGKYLIFACNGQVAAWKVRQRFWSIGSQERRAARMRKAKGHHLKEHIRTLWDLQRGRCYFSGDALGERFEDRQYSLDHLYPLASRPWPHLAPQGTHWPINLALVTPFVNSGKGGRTPEEYLAEVKKFKTFAPTPAKERRRIDSLRHTAFGDYMRKHCSEDEDDWVTF